MQIEGHPQLAFKSNPEIQIIAICVTFDATDATFVFSELQLFLSPNCQAR